MIQREINSKFGLIGDNLEFKENINLKVNDEGRISQITYNEPKKNINLIDSKPNFLILPGLINSHVHIADSFAKELGYNKGLIEMVAPPDGLKHISLENTSSKIKIMGIKRAVEEMIENGITFFVDFRERGIEGIRLLKKALEKSPIKCHIYGRFQSLDEIERIFMEANGIGLSSYRIITNEIRTILKESKREFNKLVGCHHAELKRKVELFEKLLNDNIVDYIVHGTQLIKEDLIKLKKAKISLILCPRCNGYFGVGFPNIIQIMKIGIPISLGTDNIMVNSPDLFEEMRYLYLISRVLNEEKKVSILNAKDLLKMVTHNAANNINLQNDVGAIKEGTFADLIMLDLDHSNYFIHKLNPENIYPLIVQRTKSINIKKVFINGANVFERN